MREQPIRPAQVMGTALLVLLSISLIGAEPSAIPDELIRRGNAAFDQGELEAALELYERAETRTDDPGLVAFNQATAVYRLGRYIEAERHYRMCLEDAVGQRQAHALYGLGNSLVRRSSGRDIKALKEAIECYSRCIDLPDVEDSVKNDANANREVAARLLEQARANEKEDSKPPGNGSNQKARDGSSDPGGQSDNRTPGKTGTGDKRASSVAEPRKNPSATDPDQQPGGSDLMPIPDTEETVRIPPEDAVAHLRLAADRILREHAQQRSVRAPVAGVKDW